MKTIIVKKDLNYKGLNEKDIEKLIPSKLKNKRKKIYSSFDKKNTAIKGLTSLCNGGCTN